MIAVIFELKPNPEYKSHYLDIAAMLKPLLTDVDGFISVERFQSLNDPDKLLSLSYWQDERAVEHWRNTTEHRLAQAQGRESIFDHYTLRVASVIREYGLQNREQAPQDSINYHLTD